MSSVTTSTERTIHAPSGRGLRHVVSTAWSGNLHEASVHIAQSGLLKSLGGRCVARWLVGMLVRQSRWQQRQMNIPAALDSLDDAARIAGPSGTRLVQRCRSKTIQSANEFCRQAIDKGNMSAAIELLHETNRRGFDTAEGRSLLTTARNAFAADQLARQGHWSAAISGLEKLNQQSSRPAWTIARIGWLERQIKTSGSEESDCCQDGNVMVIESETEQEAELETESLRGPAEQVSPNKRASFLSWQQMGCSTAQPPKRLLMWIDGVGHYLLCLEQQIWVGRYVPLSGIQVPVLADIDRRHLRFIRDENGVMSVEAGATTTIRRLPSRSSTGVRMISRRKSAPVKLNAGQQLILSGECPVRIKLADSVELELQHFPETGVAVLETLSAHRTVPAAASIVWIRRELQIGNNDQFPIHLSGFDSRLRLVFCDEGISFDSDQSVAVTSSGGRGRLSAHLLCGDISLALETLTPNQEIPACQTVSILKNPELRPNP